MHTAKESLSVCGIQFITILRVFTANNSRNNYINYKFSVFIVGLLVAAQLDGYASVVTQQHGMSYAKIHDGIGLFIADGQQHLPYDM